MRKTETYFRYLSHETRQAYKRCPLPTRINESNEKVEVARLKKESHLTDDEFWAAIGWLSRESKLVYATEKKGRKNIGYYALGDNTQPA